MSRSEMHPETQARRGKVGWLAVQVRVLALGLSLLGLLLGTPPVGAQTAPAEVRQGYGFLEKGWVNDAIASFRQALQRQPQSLEAKLGLAMAYQRAGQDENAWQAYQAVLAQDPAQRQALAAIGQLGAYRSEWQTPGIAALTTLLNLDAANDQARAQRALLYGYQGRFPEALADYESLLAKTPSPDTLLGAAQIYTYSGDYAQGLALFKRYQANGRTVPENALSAYALTLQETGRADQAIAVLEPRLRPADSLDPVAVQIRTSLAVAYGADGQYDKALSLLEPLRGASTRLSLARALSALGRSQPNSAWFEEATVLYQQALAATTDPSYGLRVEVADVLSEWPGTQPAALAQYRQLATENPAVVSLQVKSLALAYDLQESSAQQTAAALAETLEILPKALSEQRAIALALVRLEQPDPALLPVYQSVVAAGLNEPMLQFRIAQMQIQAGNLAEAQAALEQYRATPQGESDLAVELLIADIERQQNQFEASAGRYEALIATNPPEKIMSEALRGLVYVRMSQGELEKALPVYESVIRDYPDNPTWKLGWAYLASRTGKISEAEAAEVLDQWVATNDLTNPPPEVGQLAASLPAVPERSGLYEAVLAANPDDWGVRWRSIQLVAQRDPAEAQNQLDQLLIQHPQEPTLYLFQGELAQQQGDLEGASKAYSALLALKPEDIGALSGLAGVRFQQERFAEAQSLYEAVLAKEPKNLGARLAIAELNAAQGFPIAALAQLQALNQESQTLHLEQRIQDLQVDLLRRRGFQPPWERY